MPVGCKALIAADWFGSAVRKSFTVMRTALRCLTEMRTNARGSFETNRRVFQVIWESRGASDPIEYADFG